MTKAELIQALRDRVIDFEACSVPDEDLLIAQIDARMLLRRVRRRIYPKPPPPPPPPPVVPLPRFEPTAETLRIALATGDWDQVEYVPAW